MGSDLGHDDDVSNQLLTGKKWSKKEKEFIRLILSDKIGSVIVCILIELMCYHYTVFATFVGVMHIVLDLLTSST